ncbi:MAG: hypothetical protein WD156_07700, partial [Acidimicrobiia bacterium]
MTTETLVAQPAVASTLGIARRAMAAEWTRLRTTRSTWWSVLVAAALMAFVGGVVGADAGGEATPIWYPAEFAIIPAQFAFLLVAVLTVTGDYATGAIHSSLTWVPRRGVLLTARSLVTTAFVAVSSAIVSAAGGLMAWSFLGTDAVVDVGAITRSLGAIALLVSSGALITIGIGLVHRSTAGTLTAVFLLMLLLPIVLPNFGVAWLTAVAE